MKSLIEDMEDIKGFNGEYSFMSNMHVLDIPIEFRGILYQSTENAYQAAKFVDVDILKYMETCSPKQSKNKANKNKNLIIPNWNNIKIDIMSEVVFKKFLVNLELRKMLLKTGDVYIEETNWWGDVFYGVCDGVGENNLGKILMRTRNYFK